MLMGIKSGFRCAITFGFRGEVPWIARSNNGEGEIHRKLVSHWRVCKANNSGPGCAWMNSREPQSPEKLSSIACNRVHLSGSNAGASSVQTYILVTAHDASPSEDLVTVGHELHEHVRNSRVPSATLPSPSIDELFACCEQPKTNRQLLLKIYRAKLNYSVDVNIIFFVRTDAMICIWVSWHLSLKIIDRLKKEYINWVLFKSRNIHVFFLHWVVQFKVL